MAIFLLAGKSAKNVEWLQQMRCALNEVGLHDIEELEYDSWKHRSSASNEGAELEEDIARAELRLKDRIADCVVAKSYGCGIALLAEVKIKKLILIGLPAEYFSGMFNIDLPQLVKNKVIQTVLITNKSDNAWLQKSREDVYAIKDRNTNYELNDGGHAYDSFAIYAQIIKEVITK